MNSLKIVHNFFSPGKSPPPFSACGAPAARVRARKVRRGVFAAGFPRSAPRFCPRRPAKSIVFPARACPAETRPVMTPHFRAVPVLRAAASGLRPILRACPAGSCRRGFFSAPRLVCARPVTSRSAGQARVRLPPVRSRLFSPQPARRISARGLLPFMLPRSLFRLPRPPPFVHPCVPAPRLIPPRQACHASPARPCNPTAPHSVQAGARRFTPWLSPYADSAPGLIFFSLCFRASFSGFCVRPLLCIHACPHPGSSPCARPVMAPLHVPAIPQLRTRFRRVPAASRRGPLLTRTARPDSSFFFMRPRPRLRPSAPAPFCASMRTRAPAHPPAPRLIPLRPGSFPRALVRSAPAAPNSPKRPAAPLFSPADLCACRRAADAPSPPDFLSAPGPLSYAPSSACPKRAVLYSGRAAAPLSAVFSPQKGRSGVLTVV